MIENDRALMRVSAALASRDVDALTKALGWANQVADPLQVEEVILQSYLFLGFPTALTGMSIWRSQSTTLPGRASALDCGGWEARGQDVCRAVYEGQYDELREHVRDLHPDLELWMVVEGYGKVLGRPGLPLATRELCIVAILTVSGALKQLYSHMRGALNVGARSGDVDAALSEAGVFVDEEGRRASRRLWEKILASHQA